MSEVSEWFLVTVAIVYLLMGMMIMRARDTDALIDMHTTQGMCTLHIHVNNYFDMTKPSTTVTHWSCDKDRNVSV